MNIRPVGVELFREEACGIMHGRCCLQAAASSVHYTTSCKHSLVLLKMGEIIARN